MSRIAWRLKSGTTKGTLVDNEAGAIGLRDGWNYPGMSFEPWRVVKVRILTPAESRRKAVAEALRERADFYAMRTVEAGYSLAFEMVARELRAEADALWPRKGRREAPTRGKWVVGDDGLAREVGGL